MWVSGCPGLFKVQDVSGWETGATPVIYKWLVDRGAPRRDELLLIFHTAAPTAGFNPAVRSEHTPCSVRCHVASHLFIIGIEQRLHRNPQPLKFFIYKKQHLFTYSGNNFCRINITLCVHVVESWPTLQISNIFRGAWTFYMFQAATFSCVSIYLFRVQSAAVIRAVDRKCPREAFFNL